MRRVFLLTFATLMAPAPLAAQEPVVYRVTINGTIENGLAPYVARALGEAEAAGAGAAILDLNTPGGRVDAAERIVDAVRGTTIPVYAFVNPRAFSAGALIALSADSIFMTPGAVLGAATPVTGQGEKAPEKYVSAMRAEFRTLAEARGLDPAVAEAMVDESVGFPGLAPPGRLLTLSTVEAKRTGYTDGVVENQAALLASIGLENARVVTVEQNWAESLVRFLTNPIVAPLLLSIGMLGLILEIKAGAFGLGALASLGALGLFFGSHLLLGLAGWEEVILLMLGLIALTVEVFVLPGFGIAGILGFIMVGASFVMAMLGALPTGGDIVQALAVVGASLVIVAAIAYAWIRHLPGSSRLRGLFLHDSLQGSEGYVSALARGDLVGLEAVAVTDLRPAGTVSVGEERIDAVTEGDFIKAGSTVKILRAEGYRHVVRSL
ncbi:MAG: NfeD family protein [Gemmatimonadales bacterium]